MPTSLEDMNLGPMALGVLFTLLAMSVASVAIAAPSVIRAAARRKSIR